MNIPDAYVKRGAPGCGGVSKAKVKRPEFYRTPEAATLALLQSESIGPRVWEPACGDGAITEVLANHGRTVFSTDLHSYGYAGQDAQFNFLEATEEYAPEIVTNPPFSLARKFIDHAFEIGVERMYLLLRLAFLEGVGRREMLKKHLMRVHVFSKRLTLWRVGCGRENEQGGGMIALAWFTFCASANPLQPIELRLI